MKTRNGTPFRLYASDGIAPHVRHGAVLRPEGWLAFEWTFEGFVNDDKTPHDYDISHEIESVRGRLLGARFTGVN